MCLSGKVFDEISFGSAMTRDERVIRDRKERWHLSKLDTIGHG